MGAPLELPSFVGLLQRARVLPPDAERALRHLEPLALDLVSRRPTRGSDEEDATLIALQRLGQELVASVGAGLLLLLRQAQGDQLRGLILRPDGDLSPAKTRAAAHVQTAFETFGELVAFLERLLDGLPIEAYAAAAQIASDDSLPELDDQSRLHLRFLLACVVVIEALRGGSDEDAAFWAVEALHGASELRALLSAQLPFVDAIRGRLRSRVVWAAWDETDAELEAESWKHLE